MIRFLLIFVIVALLFMLATILVLQANQVELAPGWYLVGPPA